MKVTKSYLKQIIKEEMNNLEEAGDDPLIVVQSFINGLNADNSFLQWDDNTKGGYYQRRLKEVEAALASTRK